LVADRLDFIGGLEAMLFDTDLKKHFKERSQLHRIVARNTWVFGEEFALTVDDQSLTEVLLKHLKLMKRDIPVDAPVKRLDDTTGIVDLMLSRRVPNNREEEREHLVVELKAPTTKVGKDETAQIKSYAFAVQKDERFRGVPTRWTFWVVSTDMDDYASAEVHMRDRPEGLLWEANDSNSRIWVKTWGQILHDCKTRLNIFQKALNYSADKDASLDFLKKTYARVLSGGDLSGAEIPETSTDTTESSPAPSV
jgi:Type I restriction enzyme R protein N terminus (HSDR_N)